MVEQPEVTRAQALAGIAHGFLGSRGGTSGGLVAGLNCGLGAGDEPSSVSANRALASQAVLPGGHLVGVYQTHSAICVAVDRPWQDETRPEADALVTATPGLALGIVTADCAPVLLADPKAGVVGAAHAGWKGALAGITDSTIVAMEALGAKRQHIVAAIGPCIAMASYEVDDLFRTRFLNEDQASAERFASGAEGHWQFDLCGYVYDRLQAAEIGQIERLNLDTYAAKDRFYSFRRATHLGQPTYGRQISLIGLG